MSFEKWRGMRAAIADAQVQRKGEDFEAFMRRGHETASLDILARAMVDTLDEIIAKIDTLEGRAIALESAPRHAS